MTFVTVAERYVNRVKSIYKTLYEENGRTFQSDVLFDFISTNKNIFDFLFEEMNKNNVNLKG